MWIFVGLLAAAYLVLFYFKLHYPVFSEKLYQKFGLDIGLFQLKFSLSARSRWLNNIAGVKKFKAFYKYGTIISLLLVIPSLLFLLWNLHTIVVIYNDSTGDKKVTDDLVFQPVIPGVTFPLTDVGIYGFSLLVTTVFHELGHAVAADCLDVKIMLIIPGNV